MRRCEITAQAVHAVGAQAPRPRQSPQLRAHHDLARRRRGLLDRGRLRRRPQARLAVWGLALAIDTASPLFGFLVPGLGRSTTADWNVEGGHMAERCGLFVIIALGESILITGQTFAGLTWNGATLAAFANASSAASPCGWSISTSGRSARAGCSPASADPGRLARSGYTYLHIPIVAGIIVAAVGGRADAAPPGRPYRPQDRRRDPRRAGALSRRQLAVQMAHRALGAALPHGRARRCSPC